MHNPNHNVSPFHPVPPAALIVTAVMLLIEAGLQLGQRGLIGGPEAVGWRVEAIRALGFFDVVWERMLLTRHVQPDWIWPFFTYPFVSLSPISVLIGAAMVVSIGAHIVREYSTVSFLVTFFVSTAVGALVFGVVSQSPQPLLGPFPSLFGLLGLYTWNLWFEAKAKGKSPWGAFRIAGFLLAFQLLRWLFFGYGRELISEVAALIAGGMLGFLVTPEGRAMLQRGFGMLRRG